MKTTNGENWYQNHLADQKLYPFLEQVDADLVAQVRAKGCLACGGTLHRGDYPRKPRGGAPWDRRFSLCCATAECRRRHTPPSVRFFGRRVYAGLVVVLVSAMVHGLTPARVARVREALAIDRRTLERWRQWWRDTFVGGAFWKAAKAQFMPPLCERTLPASLCVRFAVQERRDRLLALLRFLTPLTTSAAWRKLVR